MKLRSSRILSWILVLVMVVSMLPSAAFAEETVSWGKTALSDIQATDTVAITMTDASGNTYILPTTAAGQNELPAAEVVTVTETTLSTTGESANYGWNIVPADENGGYYIKCGEYYLYTTNANNGTRIGETQAVWTLDESGYFKTETDLSEARYLGVYVNNPDWRCYKNTTGNTKDQTLGLWVLDGGGSDAGIGEAVTELTNGCKVYIYNPDSKLVMSTVADGTTLTGVVGEVTDDVLTVEEGMAALTVTVDGDGNCTFRSDEGSYLTANDKNSLTFEAAESANSTWVVETTEGGFFLKSAAVDNLYLEIYKEKYTAYSFQQWNTKIYTFQFFSAGSSGVQPSNLVATPKASPKAGEVDSGTEISFTCATEGATISYHTGDSNWTVYTAPIAITEDTTFTVKAAKEGMEDSREVKFAYTIYQPPVLGDDLAQLVTDASTLASGDRILIVTRDYDYALGITQKSNNRDRADVVKAYDKLSYNEFAQIITLESGVVADTFALYATNGDCPGYLYAAPESGNLLRTQDVKDENGSFKITIDADGTALVVAQGDKTANSIRYNTVGIFSCYGGTGQKPVTIYRLLDGNERPGMVEDGAQVVLFNQSAKGVLSGMEGDLSDVNSCTLKFSAATIVDSKALCSNGAVVFTAQKNGDYFRFYNESFGYLSATGTGNNLFYLETATDDSDWLVEEYNGGYKLASRTAAFEGNAQYLQYFSGGFTTWGMQEVIDRDVFTYHFYPCANEKLTDGVVNEPKAVFGNLAPAYAGQKYVLHFTVDALFGVKELTVTLGETELECTEYAGRYTVTIPAEMIVGESLTVTISGLDNKDVEILSTVEIEIKDEPSISDVYPLANAQTKDEKRPEIGATLHNVGEAPAIEMSINGEAVEPTYADGKVTYKPASDLADGRTTIVLTVTRADGKSVSKTWSFTVGESTYQLMFGQLHSHNGEYSDGAGTLDGALEYISSLPESANVDFVAFTDHSNYFDKSGEANPEDALYDLSKATAYAQERWSTYKNTIAEFNKSQSSVIAIAGFEMTWSGGPGHMNTFATEGIVSRNNTVLNNKSADAGMKAYYALLARAEGVDSITQLNHPGTMFGNFTDFSYWNEEVDSRVQLIEVGNGEGQIGSSGYFPSYEQYTLALDKGWHVAPTNNQDNHKGMWGNANEARDVVLAESFTEEAIYEAIRARRVYSTEDKNLELGYTVNELPMGTIIETVPETLNFSITVMDPDDTDSIAKVELIVNSGKVAYTWDDAAELTAGLLTAELNPEYSYYYVRVTESDGDLAVTAPVWVGSSLKLGISTVESSTELPVTGEELTISTTLFNRESSDALVKSVVYTTNGSEVLGVDNTVRVLEAGSTLTLDWNYTPTTAKLTTITATVVLELEGREYTFNASVELDVQDSLTYIGIDASHNNEYVTGYNKNLVDNFITLAGGSAIRVELLTTSEALTAACENADGKYSAIVLNVPSRRLSEVKDYTDAEIAAIVSFYENGGALLITGGGDTNDNQTPHMAATQNRLLAALGSALRMSDDGTYEDTAYALDFNAYGDNALTAGMEGTFSYYGGSSLYVIDAEGNATATLPETVSPVVFANAATYSKDADNDGLGGESTPKYTYAEGDERLMVVAMEEQEGKGLLLVAGAAFMNDYDLTIPAENSNNTLAANWFSLINPVVITDIAEVRAQTESGYKYTIEGTVTSNASGYDKETAFFDCIYVQDATGGICLFPVAGEFKVGDVVRVEATTHFFQGEAELQVVEIEKLGETDPVAPELITAAQLNDRSVEGKLVTVKGTVVDFNESNGAVESIYVKDEAGDIARVFIDGYITAEKEIENLAVGCNIEATGLASYDNTYAIAHDSYSRIRVRDRADVICTEGTIVPPQPPVNPFEDVNEGDWFYDYVLELSALGIINGTTPTTFSPNNNLTRAQLAVMLYRMAGEPEVTGVSKFTDLEADWYVNAVVWAEQNGIVNGTTPTTFSPENKVTREQMVVMLYRFSVDPEGSGTLEGFADSDKVSAWAVDAFAWAIGAGIIDGMTVTGMEGKYLKPQGLATRAQAAKVFSCWMALELA